MVQLTSKINDGKTKVKVSFDLREIREALEYKLYVPDIRVKNKVIDELLVYLKNSLSNPEYKIYNINSL